MGTLVERALLVIMLNPTTQAYLRENDPKAFEQAARALVAVGLIETDLFDRWCANSRRGG